MRRFLNTLRRLESSSSSESNPNAAQPAQNPDDSLRRCLLVMRDGKVVGLGGFCPVAMMRDKKWLKGSEEFVGSYDGVDYFFQSAEEREVFFASPKQFIRACMVATRWSFSVDAEQRLVRLNWVPSTGDVFSSSRPSRIDNSFRIIRRGTPKASRPMEFRTRNSFRF